LEKGWLSSCVSEVSVTISVQRKLYYTKVTLDNINNDIFQLFLYFYRQTTQELTGEHSCIMLQPLQEDEDSSWILDFWRDFRRRFVSLLSFQFRTMTPAFALSMLQGHKSRQEQNKASG
jgi:hypothetical protein